MFGKTEATMIVVAVASMILASCGNGVENWKPVASQRSGDYTVTLLSKDGLVKAGRDNLVLEFRKNDDANLAGVGNIKVSAAMSGMNMGGEASIEPSGTMGRYNVVVQLSMAGAWSVTFTYAGGTTVRFNISAA